MSRFHLPKFSTQIVRAKISSYLPSFKLMERDDPTNVNYGVTENRPNYCSNCCTPLQKMDHLKYPPPTIKIQNYNPHRRHGPSQNSMLIKWNHRFPQNSVTIDEALWTIFGQKFSHIRHPPFNENFALCTDCTKSLTQLFQSYHKFNDLRHPDSVMNSKLAESKSISKSPPPPVKAPDFNKNHIPDLIQLAESRTRMEGLVQFLANRQLTLSSCESLTGGLFAERLTDVPGSSQVFAGGFITYSNRAKNKVVKVPSQVIEKFGAVSKETALYMARNTQAALETDVVISFTGNAGPGPSENKPVGLVYIAVGFGKSMEVKECHFQGCRSKLEVKTFCVDEGIKNIFRMIEKTL